MERITALVQHTPLPRMAPVRQYFAAPRLDDPLAYLRKALECSEAAEAIRPGMRLALTVGSRGIARLPELVRGIVDFLHARGAEPFIVPAMGSHGGANAEGQLALLAQLGVTPASAGCPIVSSMETRSIGQLDNGMPVMMDARAMDADGIILFNRIKPHNSFRHHIESGLAKMLAIGLGKQSGADHGHARGFARMGEVVVAMARLKLAHCKVLMGIGTVENAYDDIARVVVLPPQIMLQREAEELALAKQYMPRLLLDPLDVLVIDRIGKEFSGGGMDANITGSSAAGIVMCPARISRIAVLDVSDRSLGNAIGCGLAHVVTERLRAKADPLAMALNALTSKVPAAARMPIALPDDRLVIQAAITTSTPENLAAVRLMRIPDTLHLGEAYISEALLPDALNCEAITILDEPRPMGFDAAGTLTDPWRFNPAAPQTQQL